MKIAEAYYKYRFGLDLQKENDDKVQAVFLDVKRQLIKTRVLDFIKKAIIKQYLNRLFTDNNKKEIMSRLKFDAEKELPKKLILKKAFEFIAKATDEKDKKN
jgi:hypothetical protein